MNSQLKKRVARRLKIIEGQVRGLQKMVAEEQYCVHVINQSLAAKQALSSMEDLILRNHISTCVVEQMKKGQEKRATDEIVKIYKLSKRK